MNAAKPTSQVLRTLQKKEVPCAQIFSLQTVVLIFMLSQLSSDIKNTDDHHLVTAAGILGLLGVFDQECDALMQYYASLRCFNQ